ncbi:hypothetical protein EV644_1343 [Kribbella orskensis]|uniref:Uncharacterized protein n=1 Tax=Kribbella orskensis TaxID=2512216 RepID=A0ABY2B7X5_9ACTN|nr:hypothetical protein EV642_1363 [Kribbella sp. VKM Ac-2500]TCO10255.1 hypothetical protein EV644_1343 [Kribbella orskensis]
MRYQIGPQAVESSRDYSRVCLPCGVQRGVAVDKELVEVSALQTKRGEVDEYAAPAAGRQILTQSIVERRFSQFGAPECYVAGTALLRQP